jgi:hypothetical protein
VYRMIRVSRYWLVIGVLILGSILCMTCKKKNQPPGAPSIPSGPTSGRKGNSLRFSTVADVPEHLAKLYDKTGRSEEARRLEERVKQIRANKR